MKKNIYITVSNLNKSLIRSLIRELINEVYQSALPDKNTINYRFNNRKTPKSSSNPPISSQPPSSNRQPNSTENIFLEFKNKLKNWWTTTSNKRSLKTAYDIWNAFKNDNANFINQNIEILNKNNPRVVQEIKNLIRYSIMD